MPEEESQDIIRVFFQIELAHWFYLDFYCPDSTEFRTVSLKEFAIQIFHHCPTLVPHLPDFESFLAQFKLYKQAVPTYGAILLDPTLQNCLLVQGYYVKASWGFPKGKINQEESKVNCAIREVLEETGFDISGLIDEELFLERMVNETTNRLYIIPGVRMETQFKAKTRQEIKNFGWFRIDSLPSHKKDQICKQHYNLNPNQFFMVIPFIRYLRQWIQSAINSRITPSVEGVGTGGRRSGANFSGASGGACLRVPDERKNHRQNKRSPNICAADDFGFSSQKTAATGHSPGFKNRTTSESPTYRLHSGRTTADKAPSPMNPSKRVVANKSTSPTKSIATKPSKPIKILSRNPPPVASSVTEDSEQVKTHRERKKPSKTSEELSLTSFSAAQSSAVGDRGASTAVTDSDLITSDYICPAWKNFKLDIDLVMLAMFPKQLS